jgi:ArsR family transcriptional regulator, arsenate/arsenite/antimonite-responsive transcriptional repressor
MLIHIFELPYIYNRTSMTPDQLCKTLADETRTRITLLVTREKELCVCELTCALDVSQPKISRHLALLRESGLLADRRKGQWVYYRLHPDLPNWVIKTLKTLLDANHAWLDENHQRLCEMEDRPNRCC